AAAALRSATHWSALVERAGKPFVAMRRVFEDLSTSDLPSPTQLLGQLRGLSTAAPRWAAALSSLAAPSRWRTWLDGAEGQARGRFVVEPSKPVKVSGVVDHVRFDAVRRRFVAEVADPRGEGLHPDDLLILLVRDGRRVDVDVVRQTSVTVRHDVVTDVVLELPLDLQVDASLDAWVLVGQRVVWKGAVVSGSAG
ncbi:MAG: hypothetical protein AAF602_30575, partial [Myxococcota bacterium]